MLKDLLIFGVGLLVGGMNAIAGGGLLLGFPAMLSYGLTPLIANATGNIAVLPGLAAAAFGYRRYLRRTPLKYAWLLVPWLGGAVVGALLLRHTPSTTFSRFVPELILFAVLLFAGQPFLHRYLHQHLKSRSKRIKPLALIGIALLPAALYAGYFGAGVGFIMMAFLGFTKLHDLHQINAMKNLAGVLSSLASIIILAPGFLLNWRVGLVMAAGTTIGGYGGARLAQHISSHAIRIIVLVIGLVTAAYLALRPY